jgi:hypothetical protein
VGCRVIALRVHTKRVSNSCAVLMPLLKEFMGSFVQNG